MEPVIPGVGALMWLITQSIAPLDVETTLCFLSSSYITAFFNLNSSLRKYSLPHLYSFRRFFFNWSKDVDDVKRC